MLVGYSSSSDEESDGGGVQADADTDHNTFSRKCKQDRDNTDGPMKKVPKIEKVSPTPRLPLPGCLLSMFPQGVDTQTEDSSLHDGRIRSFKHERGNWATYVYFPYKPEEEFGEFMESLLSTAAAFGVVLTPQEEFHLSLSQTVILRHHWIQPFIQGLKAGLAPCKRFVCSAPRLNVYNNAEKTRIWSITMKGNHIICVWIVQSYAAAQETRPSASPCVVKTGCYSISWQMKYHG
ncbi:U6 snRNA phosphodiesterase 1 isoform X3 [Syngnathoides biaculeatus]|uniref:U6 snRNA phosphodiesterase 1 isoform X3 n=1 Tax=Syngnathoides biaculeatus TaxID=300417 RepID=UPI002ADD6BEB|nr:U6 snRNA phosphodiesterase 1 isoform X3 [Syngnathoides biaculeatus]